MCSSLFIESMVLISCLFRGSFECTTLSSKHIETGLLTKAFCLSLASLVQLVLIY